MSTLNTASLAISSLVESTKLSSDYVPGASLWVFSLKDLIAFARKQGSGVTFATKNGYVTTRQKAETVISLPFFQSLAVSTFACKTKESKIEAVHSDLTWKQNGHEYPYNSKLQFSVDMCQQICLAALGEEGLSIILSNEIEAASPAKGEVLASPISLLTLLKGVSSPASWWSKMQKVLPNCNLQIQLLVVVDAAKLQNCVVKKVYNTTQDAFEFDVTEHIVGFQVVSTNSPQYIWGLGLPQNVVQVVEAREERKVTIYTSVEDIPLNSKNAQNQLTKFYVNFMNEHPEYHADQEAGRAKFLAEGINPGKLATWLAAEGNSDKAVAWLAKKVYTPAKVATKVTEFESKAKSAPAEETRQAERAAKALGETTIITPTAEPSVEEAATKLAGVFSSDGEDDSWEIGS